MPSSSNARNANARGAATAAAPPAGPAATGNDGADNGAARALVHANQQVNAGYKQAIAARIKKNEARSKIVNGYTRTIGGMQQTLMLFEDRQTGERGTVKVWGEVKNIPRAIRTKRTAEDMLDEVTVDDMDAEFLEDMMNEDPAGSDRAEQWEEEERVAADILEAGRKKKKKAATVSAAKKQKKSAAASSSSSARRDASARRENHDNDMPPPTGPSGTRRSTRVTSSSSRTPRAAARHEPIIREDQEEEHVTHDDGTHQIDEHNLRTSTRAASDDLNSLSDRMHGFEIKSEAGSESTRVFSRESSMADPIASTSRL